MSLMKDILIGMAVGDAVGVPYEFISKQEMDLNPATDMTEYGTHNQPKGTWSDDTSMALCIVDSIVERKWVDCEGISDKFTKWMFEGYWTPRGVVFDFGIATRDALKKRRDLNTPATKCGGTEIFSNGNGSVMRTLALVPYLDDFNMAESYTIINDVSSITHAHEISKMSCVLTCTYASFLKRFKDPAYAWELSFNYIRANSFLSNTSETYLEYFEKYREPSKLTDEDFDGSGFARDTAVTSMWCVLKTDNYKDAVLKAVNYGDDTDTTACVTGGLAGILHGFKNIPKDWVDSIARKGDILELIKHYNDKIGD
jgi:ADP-ribosyl-[dinitrogen reductase] hydrolase